MKQWQIWQKYFFRLHQLFKLDPNTNNTELFITPDSWDINEISKKDWDEMLPGILKSLEGFLSEELNYSYKTY
nr:hypothetical protein [Mycoplasmopsis bovis]